MLKEKKKKKMRLQIKQIKLINYKIKLKKQ